MAYSEDLRIRLVRKVASGMSRRQAAARFARRYEDERTAAVKPRSLQKRRLDPYGEDILGWIEATPDMTLQELSVRLHEVHKVAFGILGYVARKTNYHVAAILIGVILGPLLGQCFLRAIRMAKGNILGLFSSNLGNVLWLALVVSITLPYALDYKRRKAETTGG